MNMLRVSFTVVICLLWMFANGCTTKPSVESESSPPKENVELNPTTKPGINPSEISSSAKSTKAEIIENPEEENFEGEPPLHVLKGHRGVVWSVVFSPDGGVIASGGADGTIKIWEPLGSEKKSLQGHTAAVKSVAFSPDGKKLLSGSYDKTIRLWDRMSGELLDTFEWHYEYVNSVRTL